MPKEFSTGDKVVWHTGFDGFDHGKPCWWSQDKSGTVISFSEEKVLIEFENGERDWAKNSEVEDE